MPSTVKERSLSVNIAMNMLLQFSLVFLPLITIPYVSRVLEPAGLGHAQVVQSIVSWFAMAAQVGIPVYGVAAVARVRDDLTRLRQTVRELVALNAMTSALALVLLVGAVLAVPSLRVDWPLFAGYGLLIVLQFLGTEWLFKGLEEYSYLTLVSLGVRVLMVAATFLFVRTKDDVFAYLVIMALTTAGSAVINVLRSRHYLAGEGTGPLQLRHHLAGMMVLAALSAAATIYTSVDTVVLKAFKGNAEAGQYTQAVRIKQVLVSLTTAIGAVLLPRASWLVERGEMDRFRALLGKAMGAILVIGISVAVFFALFASPTIAFAGGADYVPAVAMLRLIMPSIVFIGITNVLGMQLLVPLHREKTVALSVTVGAVVDIAANLLLIPAYGGRGTAIATVIAELSVLVYQVVATRRIRGDMWRDVLWGNLALATGVASAAGFGILQLHLHPLPEFVLGGITFFGLFGLVLIVRRDPLPTDIIDRIKVIIRAKG